MVSIKLDKDTLVTKHTTRECDYREYKAGGYIFSINELWYSKHKFKLRMIREVDFNDCVDAWFESAVVAENMEKAIKKIEMLINEVVSFKILEKKGKP